MMRSGSRISLIKCLSLAIMMMAATFATATTTPPAANNNNNPSGYPICWGEINKCDPNFSRTNTTATGASIPLNTTCCPVVKTQMSDVKCFCSLQSYYLSITKNKVPPQVMSYTVESQVNTVLATCKIQGSFQDICKGIITSGSSKIAAMDVLPIAALISVTALFM